jgi:hypothetical protein
MRHHLSKELAKLALKKADSLRASAMRSGEDSPAYANNALRKSERLEKLALLMELELVPERDYTKMSSDNLDFSISNHVNTDSLYYGLGRKIYNKTQCLVGFKPIDSVPESVIKKYTYHGRDVYYMDNPQFLVEDLENTPLRFTRVEAKPNLATDSIFSYKPREVKFEF